MLLPPLQDTRAKTLTFLQVYRDAQSTQSQFSHVNNSVLLNYFGSEYADISKLFISNEKKHIISQQTKSNRISVFACEEISIKESLTQTMGKVLLTK